jgi:hypothetical protein
MCLTLYREHAGRVSLHGQVETCSYVLLNARNGLSLGICQALCESQFDVGGGFAAAWLGDGG